MITATNEPFSSLSHALGALLSVAALALLVVFAALRARAPHIVGVAIFGSTLILLYATSALYHWLPRGTRGKKIFQTLDHAMIYVLIAGTYTPLMLVLPSRGWGWSLFGVIWGLALVGVLARAIPLSLPKALTMGLYLIMGWLVLLAFKPVVAALPVGGLTWLLLGGLLYTIGVIFFGLERLVPRRRWFGPHELFHLLVLGGSFSHFWLMLRYVIYLP